jgi:hypothetical protein
LFVREPYLLLVTGTKDRFMVEFAVTGPFATREVSPDWQAATATATTFRSQLCSLVPIGGILSFLMDIDLEL